MTGSRRRLRIALIAVAALAVVLVGAGAVFLASFDPNSLKPRIAAAVERATGRHLALNGRIGLVFSLSPTVEVRDVTLSNPPGFSRPQMATLQSMRLQLALLPLLSKQIRIASLVLNHPDILLETNAAGQPNWKFTPEVSPTAPAGTQAPPEGSAQTRTEVSVGSVRIQDGTVALRDGRTGKTTTLGLPSLAATASSPDAPLHLDAEASFDGHPFSLSADTGSLTRLQDSAATTPWPVQLTLSAASTSLNATGTMTRPLDGKGYALVVGGRVPDATALRPYLPGVSVPALHDVDFSAKLADSGGKLPDISALTLHAGPADLSAQVPGLALTKLDVDAPVFNQPARIALSALRGGVPLTANATLGSLAALLPGAAPAAFPVDIAVQAAGASITAKGTIANAQALSGASIALAATVPDLAALGGMAGRPLPSVRNIALHATLTDANGGLRQAAALHALALTSAAGDLSGDAVLGLAARRSLTATLKSNSVNADAIQAAIDQMPPPAGTQAAATGQASASANQPSRDRRLFPDTPLPLQQLRAADADLTLTIGTLHSGGADYRAVATHVLLRNGDLSVNPFSADLPGGHLQATLTADASKPAPPVHLSVHAPGLALKTILEALHEPSYASGNLEVYADLSGTGASPHALAASLNGHLGVAMAGGTIDNRLLGSVLGKVMNSLNALDLVGRGGVSDLRCLALRMNARNGAAEVNPLALSSSLLTMTGGGTISLGPETLAMQLRPQARVAGAGLVIPIVLTGPLRNPAVGINKLGAAESNAGMVAGTVLGNTTPLGIVGGLLGADRLTGGGSADLCPAALAAARGEAAPKAEAPAKAPAAVLRDPAATLRNLFR